MKQTHTILAELYRPALLDDFLAEPELKTKVQKWIKENDIPNVTLYNLSPGTGKTSLAKLLVANIDCESFYLNASDDNGIDTVRDKIKQFASTSSFKPLKVVILDEAAKLSWDAQSALLNIIEQFSKNVRFILTCNYLEKIIEPLQSRCTPIKITPPSKGLVAKHIKNILDAEKIKYKPDLSDLVFVINGCYPDMRKILNTIQGNVVEGEFSINQDEFIKSSYKHKILEELKKPTSKSLSNIRQIIADSNLDDYSEMFRFLFDNIDEYGKDSIGEIIIYLEEYGYHYGFKIDKEILIVALLQRILSLIKE